MQDLPLICGSRKHSVRKKPYPTLTLVFNHAWSLRQQNCHVTLDPLVFPAAVYPATNLMQMDLNLDCLTTSRSL